MYKARPGTRASTARQWKTGSRSQPSAEPTQRCCLSPVRPAVFFFFSFSLVFPFLPPSSSTYLSPSLFLSDITSVSQFFPRWSVLHTRLTPYDDHHRRRRRQRHANTAEHGRRTAGRAPGADEHEHEHGAPPSHPIRQIDSSAATRSFVDAEQRSCCLAAGRGVGLG
ncbi:hypothetical protein JOL62DRAFT_107978 [Phyllosticta paracitricarpa]|uniref:Uncharacterized protein n=1 Tax=Phyllosticta paracitricarpa TaxID=2016321 RepID=A0ABR1N7F1_9PEZI